MHPSQLEPLQLVHYSPGEHYGLHTDWFVNNLAYKLSINGGNRLSSFFAYVHVRNDTTGGGTNFPLINAPRDEKWCHVVDCDEPWDKGVTFRPVEGNAIARGITIAVISAARILPRNRNNTASQEVPALVWA